MMRGIRTATLLLLQYVMVRSGLSVEEHQCSLFLAPSTIPNAGLGIFTSIPLEIGRVIGYGDVMIPIVDADLFISDKYAEWIMYEYTWNGEPIVMSFLSEREHGVTGLGSGLDAAINCNTALINLDGVSSQWEDGGFHRSTNPGAGAFSPVSSGNTRAKTKIPAGSELFKFYGEDYFLSRKGKFGLIPLPADYAKANDLLRKFHSLFWEPNSLLSDSIKRAIYDIMTTFPINGRVLNALPVFDDILEAVANGIESLHQPHALRSLEELESLGRCLDNIRPGRSTLPEAGRGAFATRRLPAGSIITGSPLAHIPYDEMLQMYAFAWNAENDDYDVNRTQPTGYQLLLNYCWGHAESTVLLCPYSAGVGFINHNQSLVNVKIQWAPDGQISHNSTWLQQSNVSDVEHTRSIRVAIDFVALRDIEPGEELFLDYGAEWEDAWSKHVQLWKQRRMEESDASYISAAQYNQQYGTAIIQTVKEQEMYPYPAHLVLRCHKQVTNCSGDDASSEDQRCFDAKAEWRLSGRGIECNVTERSLSSVGFVYKVTWRDSQNVVRNVSGVRRDFLAFFDRPYTKDMHLPWAFRHKMVIPDAMFPQMWRNKHRQ